MTVLYQCRDALSALEALHDESIDLLLTDPPYFGIVADEWDNRWPCMQAFVDWLEAIFALALPKLAPHGSLIFFGGIGKHDAHPLFRVVDRLESRGYTWRNLITWKKRRAYGKSHDYLFCREEIVWMSKSAERTEVRFNVPLLGEKRGYAGWDPAHPAKSEYKRVSNVWDDIPELMRPRRTAEKPDAIWDRLVSTHSNPGDLVVDIFCGLGGAGKSCERLGRHFYGCDNDPALWAEKDFK